MAEWSEAVFFLSLEEAGVQVQIPVWLLPGFFFPFIVFLPFAFFSVYSHS